MVSLNKSILLVVFLFFPSFQCYGDNKFFDLKQLCKDRGVDFNAYKKYLEGPYKKCRGLGSADHGCRDDLIDALDEFIDTSSAGELARRKGGGAMRCLRKVPGAKYVCVGAICWNIAENAQAGDAWGTADAMCDLLPANPFDIYDGAKAISDLCRDIWTYGWDNKGNTRGAKGGDTSNPSVGLPDWGGTVFY